MTTIADFTVTTNRGDAADLSEKLGTVLLVVNTASKCGFTPQYDGLEKLYQDYKDRGFEVLGFPCNQFGGQEPGNADEIARAAKVTVFVTTNCELCVKAFKYGHRHFCIDRSNVA